MENISFDVKVSKKELANFMLYHNYHSMQGILGLVISLGALVLLVLKYDTLEIAQFAILAALVLVFTVISPIILIRKAAAQEKRNKSFERPITYELREDGFSLIQGEERVDLEWRNVYKIVDTGKSLVLYISTVRAFIWPKKQISGLRPALDDMLKAHLEPRKLKYKKG